MHIPYVVVMTKPDGHVLAQQCRDQADASEMIVEMISLITTIHPDIEEDPTNVVDPSSPDILVRLQSGGLPMGSIYAYPKGVN